MSANNSKYALKEYWEERFSSEAEYEWLVSFPHVKDLFSSVEPNLFVHGKSVLVVGCGNSNFSAELFKAGVTNLMSSDYSIKVIENMKTKYPHMEWRVQDMTDMKDFSSETFDFIIDKAAMDALVVNEGDPWNPSEMVTQSVSSMMKEVYRTLKKDGTFLQISFQQPHFRKKYLDPHSNHCTQVFDVDHGLGYFLYSWKANK